MFRIWVARARAERTRGRTGLTAAAGSSVPRGEFLTLSRLRSEEDAARKLLEPMFLAG